MRRIRENWDRSDHRLSAKTKNDAREALAILQGSGLSLTEAAQIAIKSRAGAVATVTVTEAVHRFQLFSARKVTRRGHPLRPATLEWYEDFLAYLVRDFGTEKIAAIDRQRFADWLAGLKIGETARASIARAARALWIWSSEQHPPLVTDNVTRGANFAAPIRTESERLVLTVEQAEAILLGGGNYRSAFALMLFSGIRPEEIAGDDKPRLTWAHVNVKERWLRIPDTISKTIKTRLPERLPDALWAWLQPGELSRPVAPTSHRYLRERAKTLAGITEWPFDCFRHTAASYLLAATQDAGLVAEWIGHEGRPGLLHSTYRGQLTLAGEQINQAMALRYLALRPPA